MSEGLVKFGAVASGLALGQLALAPPYAIEQTEPCASTGQDAADSKTPLTLTSLPSRTWVERFLKHLKAFASLESGWDGDIAEKPTSTAIELASDILETLAQVGRPASRVAPLADGGIAVSILSQVQRLVFEVDNDGQVSRIWSRKGLPPTVRSVEGRDELASVVLGACETFAAGSSAQDVSARQEGRPEVRTHRTSLPPPKS